MTDAVEGYRSAISIPNIEAEFGVLSPAMSAALAAGSRWRASEPAFVKVTDNYIDNADRIGDYIGATSSSFETAEGAGAWTFDLATEILAWALSVFYGRVTTSAASSAANEVQVIDKTGVTAGAYTLEWVPTGEVTVPIAWNALAAAIDSAIAALGAFAPSDVTSVVAAGSVTLTFAGAYAGLDVPLFRLRTTTAAVGGTFSIGPSVEGQAAGVFTSTFQEPDPCTLNPPSFALAEGLVCGGVNASWYAYPGATINTITLTIDSRGFGKLALDLLQNGREYALDGTFTFPASESGRTDVLGRHVAVWVGDSKTAPFKIGRDELESLTIKLDGGHTTPTRINDDDVVTERQFGKGKPDAEITMALKGSKASRFYTIKRNQKTGYRPKLFIDLDPHSNPQRGITIVCSQTRFDFDQDTNDREPRQTLTFKPEANATDGGKIKWTTETAVSAYCVAI